MKKLFTSTNKSREEKRKARNTKKIDKLNQYMLSKMSGEKNVKNKEEIHQ